jgi:hypothetical protein
VRSLISFRTKQGNIKDYKDKWEIQPKT